MSFAEQERALLDLLFDRSLRADFCKNPVLALASYELSDTELDDFAQVRPDALEMDAKTRIYLLLSHWSRSFPVTFGIISSLEGGIDALKFMVDTEIMHTPPVERVASYGSRLKEWLESYAFESAEEQVRAVAILGAEFGMAWAGTSLKQAALSGEVSVEQTTEIATDWISHPVKLAPYVCAVLISQSYTQLKETLCPCIDGNYWRNLSRNPLSHSLISETLQQEDPRLLVTRAVLSHASACEPMVEYRTVELSEGFAPLFPHVDGMNSVEVILQQLQQAGAPQVLLDGVKSGFGGLMERGMLELS